MKRVKRNHECHCECETVYIEDKDYEHEIADLEIALAEYKSKFEFEHSLVTKLQAKNLELREALRKIQLKQQSYS